MTRTPAEPSRLHLMRHQVNIGRPPDLDALRERLSAQLQRGRLGERVIVVNIGRLGSERLVMFCSDNAREVLSSETVLVDAAVDTEYRPFVRSVIAGVMSKVCALREALRSTDVFSLAAACGQLCQQLDACALMAEGYAMQSTGDGLITCAGALAAASRAFRESAAVYRDNVRCMDDLHYEIMPALNGVERYFSGLAG